MSYSISIGRSEWKLKILPASSLILMGSQLETMRGSVSSESSIFRRLITSFGVYGPPVKSFEMKRGSIFGHNLDRGQWIPVRIRIMKTLIPIWIANNTAGINAIVASVV